MGAEAEFGRDGVVEEFVPSVDSEVSATAGPVLFELTFTEALKEMD